MGKSNLRRTRQWQGISTGLFGAKVFKNHVQIVESVNYLLCTGFWKIIYLIFFLFLLLIHMCTHRTPIRVLSYPHLVFLLLHGEV